MSDSNKNIVQEDEIIRKRCFIITPVGSDNSSIRRAAEGVIDSAIIPVLEQLEFEIDVPHRMTSSGSITKSVINSIVNDELVIVNLTGLNPNVMYELGIRHTARKPIVHICENGTQLPFDIAPERTLFYVNDMLGIKEIQPKLREFILSAMEEEEPNNPVYDAIQAKSVLQNIKSEDPLKYIIETMEDIKIKLTRHDHELGAREMFRDVKRLHKYMFGVKSINNNITVESARNYFDSKQKHFPADFTIKVARLAKSKADFLLTIETPSPYDESNVLMMLKRAIDSDELFNNNDITIII